MKLYTYIFWFVGLFTENISTPMDELRNDLDYRKLSNVELCILYLYNGNYQKGTVYQIFYKYLF